MNRTTTFDSPSLLGFEHTRDLIERANRVGEGYPPYNVEDLGNGAVRIVLAVAGFRADQIEVTVTGPELVIVGRREAEDEASRTFLHRGIAARGFTRSFVLADGMQVESAALEDGLLTIEAGRPKAKAEARRVPINASRQP